MNTLLHILITLILTVTTQVGGIIYLISLLACRWSGHPRRLKGAALFVILYLLSTFLLIPAIAPLFGREKIRNSEMVAPQSFLYILANRNYVRPALNEMIATVAEDLDEGYPGIRLIYLDANFPFLDGFPLLPHLSHNDGKKLDVTFIYKDGNGTATNLKRSRSGYGIYEEPRDDEFDQTESCQAQGHWQYDFSKFLSLGEINEEVTLDMTATKRLVEMIVENDRVGKLFIELHLKTRMRLDHKKIRFHGCQAVRHDDHIHFQLTSDPD